MKKLLFALCAFIIFLGCEPELIKPTTFHKVMRTRNTNDFSIFLDIYVKSDITKEEAKELANYYLKFYKSKKELITIDLFDNKESAKKRYYESYSVDSLYVHWLLTASHNQFNNKRKRIEWRKDK